MLRRSFVLLPFALIPTRLQDPRGVALVREEAQRLLVKLTRFGCFINVDGDAEPLVNKNRLQTRLELKLRQLGVPVSSGNIVPEPTLAFSAFTLALPNDAIALTLSAELLEMVTVRRLPGLSRLGRTWGGEPMLTVTTAAKAAADIEDAFNELAEMFANDYMAANPKKQ